jgi:hypothetical protein
VPGAATWGLTIDVPDTLLNAWISSQACVALGLGKTGGVTAVSWKQGTHSAKLATSLGALKLVAFSRSGAYAALTDGSAIEVWTHLDTDPSLVWSVAAASVSIAVDNSGAVVAGISNGTLVRLAGGDPRVIASGGDWRAVAFNGSQLIAADAAHTRVVSVDDNGGLTTLGTLAGAASGLAVSDDGTQIAALEDGSVEVLRSGVAAAAAVESGKGFDLLDGNFAVYVRGGDRVLDTDTGALRLTQLLNLAITAQGGSAQ